jgi:DNA-binding beta-propeller fold protein YncE
MRSIKWLGFSLTAVSLLLGGCSSGDSDSDGGSEPVPPPVVTQQIPNMGQEITPTAPPGAQFVTMNPGLVDQPDWQVSNAASIVVSPDKTTMLVLTSGYNRVFKTDGAAPDQYGTQFNWPDSNEYVFIYDITKPTPVQKSVVQVPNTYYGMVFDPSGTAFYVSGCGDDNIHIISQNADKTWPNISMSPIGVWSVPQTAANTLDLGHAYDPRDSTKSRLGNGLLYNAAPKPTASITAVNAQVAVKPCAAGLAIAKDGKTMVVANYFNDSISIFKGGLKDGSNNWTAVNTVKGNGELDLRPGKSGGTSGTPGGEYPFWVEIKGEGTSAKAYVSSIRDREIVVVGLGDKPSVLTRIPVKGQPNKMTLNKAHSRLYVAADMTDTIEVIDTATDKIVETIPVIAPASVMPYALLEYKGANTNSVTLSPDEKQLYVTNGNLNSVAVVQLGESNSGSRIIGLIPTGWYPNAVSFSGDGNTAYVVNSKSPTGANPKFCYAYGPPPPPPPLGTGRANCVGSQQYNPQRVKAGLQTFTRPTTDQLATLSAQVAKNNRFSYTVSAEDAAVMAAVRKGIQHVIYIIKENRTYDQILGDLEVGNGDKTLAEFGSAITPNQHSLARTFVTLDNFYATSEVSYDGWLWSTAARAHDVVERQNPPTYAGRALALDAGGTARNVNIALPNAATPGVTRQSANALTPTDPDLLPGYTDVGSPDGPNNEINTGHLWDAALRANLTVRNYGFFVDGTRYNLLQSDPNAIGVGADGKLIAMPASTNPPTVVAYSGSLALAPYTDPYFRGFDNNFPDFYRFKEWEREFDAKYAPAGGEDLPALSLIRFMHNHTGSYGTAEFGVNTPELQVADNDYAVGMLIEKISKSKYKNNTLIFIIEDDSQDGGDHVDSHRTVAIVAGAYVKQGAVVSTQHNTIDFIRTMEEVLGIPPMNLNDALARPMAGIFNKTPSAWSFTAVPSPYLYATDLKQHLPIKTAGMVVPRSTHDAKYWARVTKGMDFSTEDKFDFAQYNRILWTGLMGSKPYPATPTKKDLRKNRKEYLASSQATLQ